MNYISSCGLNLFRISWRYFVLIFNFLFDLVLDRNQVVKDLKNKSFDEIYQILCGKIRCDRVGNFGGSGGDGVGGCVRGAIGGGAGGGVGNDAKNGAVFHFSVFSYKDARIKDLVWQMKFNHNRWVGKFFGYCLSLVIRKIIEEQLREPISEKEEIYLIPIPIHKKRRSERGYNQTEWLCANIVENLPPNIRQQIIYDKKILFRKKYTKKQSWVGKEKRFENIVDSFEVHKEGFSRISSKKIILVDDVYTTGATMQEARRKLKASGGQKIFLVTIAK